MREVSSENLGMDLREMARRLQSESLEGPLRGIIPTLADGFAGNFARFAGPDGAWPSRKEIGDDHPLMIDPKDDYDLLGATQPGGPGNVLDVGPRELQIGVSKDSGHPGAAVHNFGYPARNIPQREYLYATGETLDRMAESFADGVYQVIFGF